MKSPTFAPAVIFQHVPSSQSQARIEKPTHRGVEDHSKLTKGGGGTAKRWMGSLRPIADEYVEFETRCKKVPPQGLLRASRERILTLVA